MQTTLNIKNFRVFDENGATFELNPITILTGANSSGKSTVNKAILLLQDFCEQIKADHNEGKSLKLGRYKLDFHKQPHSIMGNFENALHRGRTENNDRIVIEVQAESYFLKQEVILHLEFGMLKEDDLKNGYLMAYSIRTQDGTTLYSNERNKSAFMDFSSVKKDFLYFIHYQHILANYEESQYYEEIPTEELGTDFQTILSDEKNWTYPFVWQHLNRKQEWKDGYSAPATSLLSDALKMKQQLIDSSFSFNSPALGVLCYFPCLWALKDVEKKDLRGQINEAIKSKGVDMSLKAIPEEDSHLFFRDDLNDTKENILNLFLEEFEASNANSLHEFVCSLENDFFFVHNEISRLGTSDEFIYPRHSPNFDNSKYVKFWSKALLAFNVINEIMVSSDKKYIEPEYTEFGYFMYDYFMEKHVNNWIKMILEDIFLNIIPGELSYAKATLIQPRRVYPLDDDSDFSQTIKNFLEAKRKWNIKEGADRRKVAENHLSTIYYQTSDFTNKWLQRFGIAHHVDINIEAEGQSAIFKLHQGENGERATSLADEGLGILQLVSIFIKVETAILESQLNDLRNPTGMESLPYSKFFYTTIIVEEPEIHLHPKYQSLLADMFLEAYEKYNIHFIIETHSEYLIRKAQVLVAEAEYANIEELHLANPFRVYYIPKNGGPYDMKFKTSGRFENSFGVGFFDEAGQQALKLSNFDKAEDNVEINWSAL